MPEKNLVEVELHDFFLVQFLFDFQREQDFEKLARIGLFRTEEKIARHLHGDGAAAAAFIAGGDQLVYRRHQCIQIHTRMIPELIVFHRHHGIDQISRNFLKSHRNPAMFAKLC